MTLQSSRREFLKRSTALSVAGAAGPLAMSLAAFGDAAAAGATDYKALVCVFLYGGNDYANTLIPVDTVNNDLYFAQRKTIAFSADKFTDAQRLKNPVDTLPGGHEYALAPTLSKLQALWNDKQMAVMLNVGTLVQPTTMDDYKSGKAKLPPKLFSHNDQQSFYQALGPEGSTTGWGGRMGDLFNSGANKSTFTAISVAGSGVFLSGSDSSAYQVDTSGAIDIAAVKQPLFGSVACQQAMYSLITAQRSNLFEAEHTRIVGRSYDAAERLNPALVESPEKMLIPAGNSLAAQLSMVARIIAARSTLLPTSTSQVRRQVFFVSMGGFDTHDGLAEEHPLLLKRVGDAIAAFHAETVRQGVDKMVTTFTASDFGRTLNSDGDGSDHGWGSMHFVVGGDVVGKNFYGVPPKPDNDGPDDVGRGRLLPSFSVDQFAAKLGTWFGVSQSDLNMILPKLQGFSAETVNLKFMNPPA